MWGDEKHRKLQNLGVILPHPSSSSPWPKGEAKETLWPRLAEAGAVDQLVRAPGPGVRPGLHACSVSWPRGVAPPFPGAQPGPAAARGTKGPGAARPTPLAARPTRDLCVPEAGLPAAAAGSAALPLSGTWRRRGAERGAGGGGGSSSGAPTAARRRLRAVATPSLPLPSPPPSPLLCAPRQWERAGNK